MSDHGNLQKHLNANKVQQYLIDRFHQQIVDLVRQTAVSHILDSGCGEGFVLDYFQQNGLNITPIGADLRPEAIQWAKANLLPNLNGTVADIHDLPFPDNSFPLVMSLEVLEHIPDSSLGLRELLRVSSQYVLISVPHEPFFRGANFLRGKHLSRWGNDPEHLHNYSGRAVRQLISSQATVIAHRYTFPWQIILAEK